MAGVVNDPVADMLTRIRNATQALHEKVEMPTSRMRCEIARILAEEGYVEGWEVLDGAPFSTLRVTLKYGPNRERVITGLKRVSKPGRRVYAKRDRPHKVMGGLGTVILSTSSGVVTGRQAQERGMGGEVLCYIW
jgi:small subunit ribosomal protein S8